MKVYIAGKITDDPDYKAKFARMEQKLAEEGHSVMNPAWLVAYPEFTYANYCDVGEAMLKACDACLFLKDWEDSYGAIRERQIASRLGKKIYDETDDGWIEGEPFTFPQKRKRKRTI